ncbi:hypothetical protein CEXT_753721 [Caerostris extrusa]|uniref:Uncharacterized protein n=1 Tax=Caerostris extrusa TaxID=172846 RepID=A0AAV4YFC1_CAEEX|nr:hypothetical protein CEXT_753721 [Caerostris extrusa]
MRERNFKLVLHSVVPKRHLKIGAGQQDTYGGGQRLEERKEFQNFYSVVHKLHLNIDARYRIPMADDKDAMRERNFKLVLHSVVHKWHLNIGAG